MAAREPPLWQVAYWVTAIRFVSSCRSGRPTLSRGIAWSPPGLLPSSAYGMWQAAHSVARKFPRSTLGAVVAQVIAAKSVSRKPGAVRLAVTRVREGTAAARRTASAGSRSRGSCSGPGAGQHLLQERCVLGAVARYVGGGHDPRHVHPHTHFRPPSGIAPLMPGASEPGTSMLLCARFPHRLKSPRFL